MMKNTISSSEPRNMNNEPSTNTAVSTPNQTSNSTSNSTSEDQIVRRNKIISVRFTDDELRGLSECARVAHMSISDYVRIKLDYRPLNYRLVRQGHPTQPPTI